jgi:hypothetical protein
MPSKSRPSQPAQDPRNTIERGKEHVAQSEDRARRDPSPAREAGDGPPSPGKRERAPRDDERTQSHDVLTPDDVNGPQR